MWTTDILKDEIAAKLDVLEFLDIIGVEMSDLVELLEEYVQEYSEELKKAVE